MRTIPLALVSVLAATWPVPAQDGTDRYHLGSQDYDVPHRYEFSRTVGLRHEADGSLWLIVPAEEVSKGLTDYKPLFRGYVGPVAADLIVHVLDDPDGLEYGRLRARAWSNLDARMAEGATREPEPTGGVRVVYSVSPPEPQGGQARSFYLLPTTGIERPPNMIPASCLASPDSKGRERFNCSYILHTGGLTFDFSVEHDNIGAAPRVPAYILGRLAAWRS